jgi:uncharacterized protein (DUF2132 family)
VDTRKFIFYLASQEYLSLADKWPGMQANAQSNDPLHGLTLEKLITQLVDSYGWEELGEQIRINCFTSNPSIQSSLKFLRKTPWARTKVEDFYKYSLRKGKLKNNLPEK